MNEVGIKETENSCEEVSEIDGEFVSKFRIVLVVCYRIPAGLSLDIQRHTIQGTLSR